MINSDLRLLAIILFCAALGILLGAVLVFVIHGVWIL